MYLDPGFGSMLIQLLVASLAALAVGFGVFRQKIKAIFSKGKRKVETEDADVEVEAVGEDPDGK